MRLWTALSVFLVSILAGSSMAASAPVADEQCWVSGYETAVRCVAITVPLSYEEPDGQTVTLAAVVTPAISAKPASDALFVFAGGPGQPGRDLSRWLGSGFREILHDRDIVLVDVRGTGRSDPLNCDAPDNLIMMSGDDFARMMAACAAHYGERARHHSAREIVEDTERLRIALGYDKISIWGGSFGTRVAQHYARIHPDHVSAVILDAFTPVGESLFVAAPRYAQQSLDHLIGDCERDAECRSAFPRLRSDIDRLLARAEDGGVSGLIPNPQTGEMTEVRLNRDLVAGIIRGGLYGSFSRPLIPLAVERALAGDLRPLMGLAAATAAWSTDTMSVGMTVGYLCSEDVEQARHGDSSQLNFGFMRDSYYRYFVNACAVWPYEPLPEDMMAPRRVNVPALVISGELDPITPPQSGQRATQTFSSVTHLVVPSGQHTNSSDPCVAHLMAEFLRHPQSGLSDQTCLANRARPHFLTSMLD